MPRRTDIKRVLVIGSGPIVIGQACEFDYSGTQACKALRAEGLEVILVNSNPATIMTDPEIADRTYVEPLTPEILEQIIDRERPDAVLPTVGGQTALNLAVALGERGILAKYGVELIGASVEAIMVAEDRLKFRDAMREIGADVPESRYVRSMDEALAAAEELFESEAQAQAAVAEETEEEETEEGDESPAAEADAELTDEEAAPIGDVLAADEE